MQYKHYKLLQKTEDDWGKMSSGGTSVLLSNCVLISKAHLKRKTEYEEWIAYMYQITFGVWI